MGGDQGVDQIVFGAAQVSLDGDFCVVVVGDLIEIQRALSACAHDPRYLQVYHAHQFIEMGEDPSSAIDRKPMASINVAAGLVNSGIGDALVSAGNTGAVILAASKHFRRLKGVRRAALAAVYPTELRHGPKGDPFALMLDVGATLHVESSDLVAFAIMGSAYAQIISDNPAPKVALLSNGAEASKGAPEVVDAHRSLAKLEGLNFIGNVEGLDIPKGSADVIVCEGFLGNVALKMLEGVSEVASELAKDAYAKKIVWRLGLTMLSQGLRQLRSLTDWKQYGGAPVLGLERIVIKAHGRSNARAIRNAIKVAGKAVKGRLSEKIQEGLSLVPN
jgi:phosphate acyltransferase